MRNVFFEFKTMSKQKETPLTDKQLIDLNEVLLYLEANGFYRSAASLRRKHLPQQYAPASADVLMIIKALERTLLEKGLAYSPVDRSTIIECAEAVLSALYLDMPQMKLSSWAMQRWVMTSGATKLARAKAVSSQRKKPSARKRRRSS